MTNFLLKVFKGTITEIEKSGMSDEIQTTPTQKKVPLEIFLK